MKLFSNHKIIKTDLGNFTLADALEKLEQEACFKQDASFYPIKRVNDNHLIFGIPRDRVSPAQIHAFEYKEAEKRIEVKSQYRNLFFPGFVIYFLPLQAMYMGGMELISTEWKTFFFMIIGITIFNLFVVLSSLKSSQQIIERELAIRLNYLARNKR